MSFNRVLLNFHRPGPLKPLAKLGPRTPTAVRLKNKPKAEQETAQPTAARFNKTFHKRKNLAFLTVSRSENATKYLATTFCEKTLPGNS